MLSKKNCTRLVFFGDRVQKHMLTIFFPWQTSFSRFRSEGITYGEGSFCKGFDWNSFRMQQKPTKSPRKLWTRENYSNLQDKFEDGSSRFIVQITQDCSWFWNGGSMWEKVKNLFFELLILKPIHPFFLALFSVLEFRTSYEQSLQRVREVNDHLKEIAKKFFQKFNEAQTLERCEYLKRNAFGRYYLSRVEVKYLIHLLEWWNSYG